MSKLSSKELFSLIKTLSKSEKRYFKVTALNRAKKEDINYITLFDVLDKLKEYDDKVIRAKTKSIKPHLLPKYKYFLHELIFKSLRAYHSNSSIDAKLKDLLQNIELCFERRLYKQCEKIIGKAKQLAVKYEKHITLFELSGWEIQLIRVQSFQGKSEGVIKEFYEEAFSMINKCINEKEYEQLSIKMFMQINKIGFTRSNADLKVYKDILRHPLLDTSPKILSFQALYNYYTIYGGCFFIQNDFTNACFYTQKLVELLENNPHQLKEKLQVYVTVLNNLTVCQSNLKKYKEMTLTLKKLKEIPERFSAASKNINSLIFYHSNNEELNMYLNTGEFDKGIKLITSIEHDLTGMKLSKVQQSFLHYNISCVYFGVGNYRETRSYLNKIINDTAVDVRGDIYCMARIVLLIVHYELGNEELLEYMEKSAHHYLDKKNRLYKVETAILDFIKRKLPKIVTGNERIAAFKELKTDLEEITKAPFEKKALEYFDFISWLESKIYNRPFAEIVKKKASR